ncbi:baseplate J/gp47 family protein [Aminipila terrae]|uniref:Uncharacterized protein n=1 Tax=Aminipila terrae TaxID=2697030 RepID=A0A6P1MHD6_9FIRM|nr:baseplate J/gp47 family protein [Aminipila terrae]QHI72593.1 hypothetical protein Ami3637_09445 [Aminipila terrae]
MLPNIDLDDERFADITEKAKKLITKYAPEWTDYNAHDPGITFIEMFAWLKELQQYRMDQIGIESRKKFLKLLGIKRIMKEPAKAYVKIISSDKNMHLGRGFKIWADNIPFETEEKVYISKSRIIEGILKTSDKTVNFSGERALEGENLWFYIFGRNPEINSEFYLLFDNPFEVNEEIHMFIDIFNDYEIHRNPIGFGQEMAQGITDIKWQYYSKGEWKDLQVLADETFGLIQSGMIKFKILEEMCSFHIKNTGFYIRAVLNEGVYDVPPVLTGISINVVPVKQQDTVSEYEDFLITSGNINFQSGSYLEKTGKSRYFILQDGVFSEIEQESLKQRTGQINEKQSLLIRRVNFLEEEELHLEPGIGNGFPYQEFKIQINNVMQKGFEIFVEGENGFTVWQRVEDFDISGPESKHYNLDEEQGIIRFGDCEKGMAPDGRIIIIGCRTTMGQNGCVKENQIKECNQVNTDFEIIGSSRGLDGRNTETLDECFKRFQHERFKVERAVTYEDYERIVKSTPGLMVNNCKAIPASKMPKLDGSIEENCINIVVQPYSMDGFKKLSKAYINKIYEQLETRRLIGTKVNVLSPEYIGIVIFAEIAVKAYYRNAEQEIKEAVNNFFSRSSESFGRPVQYSTIYGIIDTLECVSAVNSLVIDAQGRSIRRSSNGDVMIPENGMVYIKEAEYVLTVSE